MQATARTLVGHEIANRQSEIGNQIMDTFFKDIRYGERNPKQGYEQNAPAAGNFVDWRDQNRVFAQMAIYAPSRRFNLSLGDQPEQINGAVVSTSLFELLGVHPVQGRTFSSEEELKGSVTTEIQNRKSAIGNVNNWK
jgi:hypothetical protein